MLAFAVLALGPLALLQQQDQRVADIAYRLATRGVAHCPGRIVPLSGLRVHIASQYEGRARSDAVAQFGFRDYPKVLTVAEGSRAASGLRVGDEVLAVGNAELGDRRGNGGYSIVAAFETAMARDLAAGGATVRLRRNGQERTVTLAGDPGCASTVELIPSRKLNASAGGGIVQITTGVLAETQDDAELAFVIAHEMAHTILRHAETPGSKRAEEDDADRLGLKLMHAAGYDPQAAVRFWTRFGKKTGYGILSDGSHRRTKARVAFLTEEAAKLAK